MCTAHPLFVGYSPNPTDLSEQTSVKQLTQRQRTNVSVLLPNRSSNGLDQTWIEFLLYAESRCVSLCFLVATSQFPCAHYIPFNTSRNHPCESTLKLYPEYRIDETHSNVEVPTIFRRRSKEGSRFDFFTRRMGSKSSLFQQRRGVLSFEGASENQERSTTCCT